MLCIFECVRISGVMARHPSLSRDASLRLVSKCISEVAYWLYWRIFISLRMIILLSMRRDMVGMLVEFVMRLFL